MPHFCRVGQNHTCIGIYGVHTVLSAGKSLYIRTYTVQKYGSGQPYTFGSGLCSPFLLVKHPWFGAHTHTHTHTHTQELRSHSFGTCLCSPFLSITHSLVHTHTHTQELRSHRGLHHPQCQFCKTHFYGNDELYAHVRGARLEQAMCAVALKL